MRAAGQARANLGAEFSSAVALVSEWPKRNEKVVEETAARDRWRFASYRQRGAAEAVAVKRQPWCGSDVPLTQRRKTVKKNRNL
jgi:hypothetical protein